MGAKAAPKHDPIQAEACGRMEPVVETVHVSVEECQELLRKGKWPDETITMIFEGVAPPRIQMRTTMLVVKGRTNAKTDQVQAGQSTKAERKA